MQKKSVLVDKKITKISIHDENNKSSDEFETTYTYDSQSRLIRTDDFANNTPSGNYTTYDYSEVGKVKMTNFNNNSNVQQRTLHELNSKNLLYKTYFNNVANNFVVELRLTFTNNAEKRKILLNSRAIALIPKNLVIALESR